MMTNFLYIAALVFASWLQIGVVKDSSFNTGINSRIVFETDGTPVAIYGVGESLSVGFNQAVYVKRWNGTDWDQIGTYLDTRRNLKAKTPSIAIDSNDVIYAAFYESTKPRNNLYNIQVKKWNGTEWEAVGGALNRDAANSAFTPSLVIDAMDRPIVAFTEFSGAGSSLYVVRWDGSEWNQIGDAVDVELSDSLNRSGMTLNVRDNPVVAYRADGVIRVRKWNGRRWLRMGDALNFDTAENAYGAAVSMGSRGRIFASWHEHNPARGGFTVYTSEWRGGAWHRLGGIINDTRLINKAWGSSLDIRGATVPLVSWVDFDTRDLYVSQYVRSRDTWITVSGKKAASLFGVANQIIFRDGKTYLTFTNSDQEVLLLEKN